MRIGAFITITRPEERGDLYNQCYNMAKDCFDEVTIIDGADTWKYEFEWTDIGKHFQWGYERANTDWVFHLDTDFIFHEQDFSAIREACETHPDSPAVSFYKWQFIQPHKYNLKSRLLLAVNKKKFGNRIKFNGGGDLCQPTLDGHDLDLNEMPQSGVAFYNYEHLLKTKEQTREDVERMDRAYHRRFNKWLYSTDGTDAFDGWLHMVKGRYQKPQKELSLDKHPKYVQETIKNLKPENFGYNGWGLLDA